MHVRPRDGAGQQTLSVRACDAAVAAIRAAAPGLPVGLSTAQAIDPDPFARAAAVRAWRQPPDFISVNLSELGWQGIMRAAVHAGIGIEAGLATRADAEEFSPHPFVHQVVRALVEVDGGAEDARAIAELIPAGVPQLWHGYGERTWEVLAAAPGRGRRHARGAWKTSWSCPTAGRPPAMRSWSPPPWRSSRAPAPERPGRSGPWRARPRWRAPAADVPDSPRVGVLAPLSSCVLPRGDDLPARSAGSADAPRRPELASSGGYREGRSPRPAAQRRRWHKAARCISAGERAGPRAGAPPPRGTITSHTNAAIGSSRPRRGELPRVELD